MSKTIQIFNRHCFFSDASKTKGRPEWFDREKCFLNLRKTMDADICDYHFIFDSNKGEIYNHFLKNYINDLGKDNLFVNCGKEADSFLMLLDYICTFDFSDDTIVYIVEDDYLHRPNWCEALLEGFELGANYVTLFDHADKYSSMYPNLASQITVGKISHWRTIPSTTNTYAMKFKTLKEDLVIHKFYSTNVSVSLDHQKFLTLGRKGRTLISPIPAYSTHADIPWVSPIIDWAKYV